MKQLLLTLGMIIAVGGGLLAQDVIWTEDFSEGLNGWSSNNPSCTNYQGGNYGTWRATSITLEGAPIDVTGITFDWTFLNPVEYSLNFYTADGSTYATAYARYTNQGDTLVSEIDAADVVAGTSFELFDPAAAGSRVLWSSVTSASVDPASYNLWNGSANPIVTFDGTTMTHTSQDGATVLVFERISQCPQLWYWTPNGNWTSGFGTNSLSFGSTILSETADNGSVIAVGHMQITLGDPNFDAGFPPYPEAVSELISPPIDISAANSGLSLQWTQSFATVNAADDAPGGFPTSFSVSTDDGASWSAPINMNEGANSNVVFRNSGDLAIPSAVIGGATSIRLKFTHAQDFYFFGLDDIALVERNPYEMQANENFFAIAPNWATPWSQLSPMAFMSDIQNNGGATATNVNLSVAVFNEGGQQVHSGSLNYGDIAPDSLAENSFIPGVLDLPADPSSVGQYIGVYALTHDSIASESNTTNDSLFFDFFVTDTLYSKAPTATRSIAPGADDSYLFGNIFYVPRGAGWFARTISFEMTNADDIAGYQNNSATILLYEWDGDLNADGQANPEEYNNNAVGVTEYIFDGSETGLITVPIVDLLEGEAIPLQDDKYYMAVVQFVAAQADDTYFMAAAEDTYNYGATAFISDSLSITGELPATYYGPVLEVGNPAGEAVTFSTFAFGRNRVPIVEMSIGLNGDLTMDPLVSTDDVLPADYIVETFPNPATEYFTLNLDMPEMQDVEVVVYDLKGQTLFFQEYDDLQTGNFRYDVADLPAGMYFVRVTTDAGSRTLKVSVQR